MKNKKMLMFLSILMMNLSLVFADVGNFTEYSSSEGGLGIIVDIFSLLLLFDIKTIIFLAIVVVVFLAVIKFMNRDGKITDIAKSLGTLNSTLRDMPEEAVMTKILASDPNFDVMQFKGKVGNMYVSLQEAWEHKDWKIARTFESDQLFNTHANMLREYAERNRTNIMDNISIKDVVLTGYSENKVMGLSDIKVKISVSQIDYIKDDETGKVVQGNPRRPISSVYEWTLTRKLGVTSEKSNRGTDAKACPNCGAPLSIGSSGQCSFCGSVVSSGEYDWVLSRIEKISQN